MDRECPGTPRLAARRRRRDAGQDVALLIQGRALLVGDDLDAATASFTEALELGEPYRLSIVSLIARSHLGEIHRRVGRSAEARAAERDALTFADAAAPFNGAASARPGVGAPG